MARVTRIDQVREIILGDDHAELVALNDRVTRPERRADDVAEVLPDSIKASHGPDGRLVEALRDPLRQCMAHSVRDEPEQFANVLFPIMGPAIRRAVAQAFKDWAQQFNQALEHSLSPRGLNWRFQAWRAGVPFGQFVLQRTLLYRVEHVYLIQARTGRLIRHLHQADAALRDDDAVSAMFTAIQEFIRDAFSGDYTQRLRTAELGELTVWAVHGPHGVLVTVIRGVPPASLRATLEEVVESIETNFSDLLSDWTGEQPVPREIEAQLARCLSLSASVDQKPAPSIWSSPAFLLLLLVIMIGLYLASSALRDSRTVDQLRRAIDATPGIVVSELAARDDRIIVRGMRDPLAPTAASVASREGWEGEIDESWTPFLSLEPDLVSERARRILEPPPGVDLVLVGDTLQASGRAAADWRDSALVKSAALPGVRSLDLSRLQWDREFSLEELNRVLQPPPEVEMTLKGNHLSLSGQAPQSWLDGVPDRLAVFEEIESLDLEDVVVAERHRMTVIEGQVRSTTIRFDGGARLDAQQSHSLATIATLIHEYGALASEYGEHPVLTVTGHTDDSGSDSVNILLERQRAMMVADHLRVTGLPPMEVNTVSDLEIGGGDHRTRGATFALGVRATRPQ